MTREITDIIKMWKAEAHVDGVILVGAYPTIRKTLQICTHRPGSMIGKGGSMYYKYLNKIQRICPTIEKIEFIETDKWYIR